MLLLTWSALGAAAQSTVYLFPEFTPGTIAMKNKSIVKTDFNLDIFHDKLLYKDGGQVMELDDLSNVASLHVGDRTFIPVGRYLYEIVDIEGADGNLLVKWHRKKNPMGKKGAYGQVAHAASTISIDPGSVAPSAPTLSARGPEEAYDTVHDNAYIYVRSGKQYRFSDKKSLVKIFPEHKDEISAFIDREHLSFMKPEDVFRAVAFAASL